jgi:hypothetical protein
VSHDELRALLPRYAAADLDMAEAARVGAHLSECRDCLHAVFAGEPSRAGASTLPGHRSRPRRALLAALVTAMAVAGLAAWTASALRARQAWEASVRAYLAELESGRAQLASRLGRLKQELAATRSASRAVTTEGGAAQDEAAVQPADSQTPPRSIRYVNDVVSLSVSNMSLRGVLEEIGRQSGAVIRGQLTPDREVSVQFDNLALSEALDRLLGGQNFVLVYGQSHRPRVVELLGASIAAGPAASAVPREDPSARAARSLEATLGLLDAHPAASLEGKLAEALGADAMSLRQLVDTGLHHPYQTIRARAMRRFLGVLESDPDLGSAMLGTLAELDDAALGDLARSLAGDRAEEMLFYVATQASGELRSRAAALLEEMRTGADIVRQAG